jgi:hypothetical protein
LRLNASTGGGQDGTAALQTRPDVPGWIAPTWNRPVSSLASAPVMPTTATATGKYETSSPLGCNNYVQSPKG